jgi:hypothetical protein
MSIATAEKRRPEIENDGKACQPSGSAAGPSSRLFIRWFWLVKYWCCGKQNNQIPKGKREKREKKVNFDCSHHNFLAGTSMHL